MLDQSLIAGSTSMVPILPPYIDSTMRATAVGCMQKFYAEFCLGLRSKTTNIHLHAGGCFAKALETYYHEAHANNATHVDALTRTFAAFEDAWGDFSDVGKSPKTKDAMWTAVLGYLQKWPMDSDDVQPFHFHGGPTVEFSFAIPLEPAVAYNPASPDTVTGHHAAFPLHPVTGDPWLYTGRCDMVGKHGGTVCTVDQKTASRLESTWFDQWNLRSQFIGYNWALRHYGISCNKTVVRGIIVRSRDIEYIEAIKTYPDYMFDRWHEQLRRDLWRITRAWNEKYFDFNLGDECTKYGMCQFMDRCTAKDPNAWNSNYVVRRWNPISKNPIDASVPLPSPAARAVIAGNPISPELIQALV